MSDEDDAGGVFVALPGVAAAVAANVDDEVVPAEVDDKLVTVVVVVVVAIPSAP